jgi:hypothetical protein
MEERRLQEILLTPLEQFICGTTKVHPSFVNSSNPAPI